MKQRRSRRVPRFDGPCGSALVAVLSTLAPAAPTAAQEFENLRFFPEDITQAELIDNMKGFAALNDGHVDDEDVPFAERDWASEERATKKKP